MTLTPRIPRLLSASFALPLMTGLFAANAVAEPASLSLDFTCDMPWVGSEPTVLQLDADLPRQVPVGWRGEDSVVEASTTVPSALRGWMRFFGARTLEGTIQLYGSTPNEWGEAKYTLSLPLSEAPIPSSGGDMVVSAPAQPFMLGHASRITADLDIHFREMTLILTARNASGDVLSGSLGQSSSDCVLAGAQDTYLHTFEPTAYTLSPSDVDFGDVQTGLNTGRQVELTNASGQSVAVQQIEITGPDAHLFSYSEECGVVDNGRLCRFSVLAMAPADNGGKTATLTVTLGDSESTKLELPLAMNVVDRQYAELSFIPNNGDFGPTPVGLPVEKRIALQRAGNSDASGTGPLDITLTGPDAGAFTLQSDCTELPDSRRLPTSCEIRVGFLPLDLRDYNATLEVDAAIEGVEDLSLDLTGTGTDSNTGYQTDMEFRGVSPGPDEADGYAPFRGSLTANIVPGQDAFEGTMDFLRFSGNRYSFSNISWVINSYQLETRGPLTGTVTDGSLSASIQVGFRVPSTRHMVNLTAGNLPASEFADYGRDSCRSTEDFIITVESVPGESFSWQTGGQVRLSYDMPGITGCGYYAGLAHREGEEQRVQQTIMVDLTSPD